MLKCKSICLALLLVERTLDQREAAIRSVELCKRAVCRSRVPVIFRINDPSRVESCVSVFQDIVYLSGCGC